MLCPCRFSLHYACILLSIIANNKQNISLFPSVDLQIFFWIEWFIFTLSLKKSWHQNIPLNPIKTACKMLKDLNCSAKDMGLCKNITLRLKTSWYKRWYLVNQVFAVLCGVACCYPQTRTVCRMTVCQCFVPSRLSLYRRIIIRVSHPHNQAIHSKSSFLTL